MNLFVCKCKFVVYDMVADWTYAKKLLCEIQKKQNISNETEKLRSVWTYIEKLSAEIQKINISRAWRVIFFI